MIETRNTVSLRECICVYLPQCLCEHISVSNTVGSFQCLDSSRVFNGLATNDVPRSSQQGTTVIHIEGGRVPEGSHPVRGQGFSLGTVVPIRLLPEAGAFFLSISQYKQICLPHILFLTRCCPRQFVVLRHLNIYHSSCDGCFWPLIQMKMKCNENAICFIHV